MDQSKVKVAVRVRPILQKEDGQSGIITIYSNSITVFKRKYVFDHVFGEELSEEQFYDRTAAPMLDSFMNGFNCTILAYGQTGSGKTHTMGTGDIAASDAGSQGLVRTFAIELFKEMNLSTNGNHFQVKATYIEVYGEDVRDLLQPITFTRSDSSKVSLRVRDDKGKVYVEGLQEHIVKDAGDSIFEILRLGAKNRETAATDANARSSRSHAVFTLHLEQKIQGNKRKRKLSGSSSTSENGGAMQVLRSKFTFVDLAGSERVAQIGAEGRLRSEGIDINQGLSTLGRVINSIAEKAAHVPYRDSKLTKLLQDALGGNSQTLFLACVSPTEANKEATCSTLQYARQAMKIQNAPVRNLEELGKPQQLPCQMELQTQLQDSNTALQMANQRVQVLESQVEALQDEVTRLKKELQVQALHQAHLGLEQTEQPIGIVHKQVEHQVHQELTFVVQEEQLVGNEATSEVEDELSMEHLEDQELGHNFDWDDGAAYDADPSYDAQDDVNATTTIIDTTTNWLTTQQKAAAKIASYVDAGASSSDDNHKHHAAHQRNTSDASAVKGKCSGSDSGESEEDWNDTSSSEEDESSGSDDGTSSESATDEGNDGDSEGEGDMSESTDQMAREGSGSGVNKETKGVYRYWSDDMDARLTEAVQLHGNKWTKVAKCVGGGIKDFQCSSRWNHYLKPLQQGLQKGSDWTEAELAALPGLVEQHIIQPYWSKHLKAMTKERNDWTAIGQELGRVPQDCQAKWISILASKMKKGPYTAEEDALIRQRVAEWGGKAKGLWISLQEEMGRSSMNIRYRWNTALRTTDGEEEDEDEAVRKASYRKRKGFGVKWTKVKKPRRGTTTGEARMTWNDDMDTRLTEAVEFHGNKWAKVAVHVGGGVTSMQCNNRWNMHLKQLQRGLKKGGDWTEAELAALPGLVEQHTTKPYWNKREKVKWSAIDQELGRVPQDCQAKWISILASKMKKGPYTAEEDALIRQRVAEWGNKGKGLWTRLQKEMCRPNSCIRRRYYNRLKKEVSK